MSRSVIRSARVQPFILVLCVVAAIAGDLPFGKAVSPADRSLVVKLLGSFADDANPQTDLDIAKIDLNGDRRPDYVVAFTNPSYCGSRGCSTEVFLSDGDKYRRADLTVHGIALGDGRTRGVRDLVSNGTTRWSWDGRTFQPANPGSAQ